MKPSQKAIQTLADHKNLTNLVSYMGQIYLQNSGELFSNYTKRNSSFTFFEFKVDKETLENYILIGFVDHESGHGIGIRLPMEILDSADVTQSIKDIVESRILEKQTDEKREKEEREFSDKVDRQKKFLELEKEFSPK